MYCRKCGALVDPQEKFCGSCGAIIEHRESGINNLAPLDQESKKNHKLVGMVACVIVGILVFTGIFAIFNQSEDPKVVVEKYLNASLAFDYDTINKYSPFDIKEVVYERLKKEYGADYKISINIVETTELSDSEMNNQLDTYKDIFDNEDFEASDLIDLDKIKAMCRVRGKLSIEGSEDEDSNDFELYCVKIGGKWKVLGNPSSSLY